MSNSVLGTLDPNQSLTVLQFWLEPKQESEALGRLGSLPKGERTQRCSHYSAQNRAPRTEAAHPVLHGSTGGWSGMLQVYLSSGMRVMVHLWQVHHYTGWA